MMSKKLFSIMAVFLLVAGIAGAPKTALGDDPSMSDYTAIPPFISDSAPPMVLLVLGRDHKLYYEAYNDASDLDGDGVLDIGYQPSIEYYGYFDSGLCYVYNSSAGRFEPSSATTDKKCSGTSEWSGDWLNYMTMSRIDVLRKVLYGGKRSVDTATETVLERSYIPRDGHSWGKEYESIDNDGYDIREYTPLSLPESGTRHLFANTTIGADTEPPLFEVLNDSAYRVWDWVSTEGPVAGHNPAGGSIETNGTNGHYHPSSHDQFLALVQTFGTDSHMFGSGEPSSGNINCGTTNCNPYDSSSSDEYYLTILTGTLTVPTDGTYYFGVNGDDAVEVMIDGQVVAGWYGGHGLQTSVNTSSGPNYQGSITLTAGEHVVEFHHEEGYGSDSYYLWWKKAGDTYWEIIPSSYYSDLNLATYDFYTSSSTITDYNVRVQVGVSTLPGNDTVEYPSGVYKPTGLLQKFGDGDRMKFGLLTGSYRNNAAGGVLRKPIGSMSDEIIANTGQFNTSTNGIIQTINKLQIIGFSNTSGYSYSDNCGWIATRPINSGECRMWGNPVAEMMYEGMRYFSGAGAATSAFASNITDGNDYNLTLPLATWDDPFVTNTSCSKPFMLVISDINPSYDSDQVPGTYFDTYGGTLGTMNVKSLADAISTSEGIGSDDYYIGQSLSTSDTACTAKNVNSLGTIRGLCPEEPTKKGSYYSASVSYYGHVNDINNASGDQNVKTYTVGLASPLPKIEIPINDHTITLVPFAKSVGGYSISAVEGNFQPTNTIVDFYITELTSTYGKFRINFEDVEQGADHDMDAIVIYEYTVNADNTVTITLTSEYAAGSIIQHLGYIISGTTNDGIYLEVRDEDTAETSDPLYFLDTPPNRSAPRRGTSTQKLPLTNTRTFTPSSVPPATLLDNPLVYAAKWGAFIDVNSNNVPDLDEEWDEDEDGVPDTYFYVTNPLYLEEKLTEAFVDILRTSSSGTAVSVLATSSEGEGTLVQAYFKASESTGEKDVTWIGYLHTLWVDSEGRIREDTDQSGTKPGLDILSDKIVEFFFDSGTGEAKFYRYELDSRGEPKYTIQDDDGDGVLEEGETIVYDRTTHAIEDLTPVWEAGSLLSKTDASARVIKTFVDLNHDGVVDTTEFIDFNLTNVSSITPFLGVIPSYDYLGSTKDDRASNLIRYIRGDDSNYTGTTDIRYRQIDSYSWKLGDIVHSTPVTMGKPMDNYSLIYGDQTYASYYKANKDREQVVFVGANDGMLHAFYMGKYVEGDDTSTSGVTEQIYFDKATGVTAEYGQELWSFIPQALLPHLKWLADPDYTHVYYVDLKPKVVDAKVFTDDSDHPGGWGTILLCGLNLGGGDISFTDTFSVDATRVFTPSFFAIDVTDPHNPKLMWEKSFSGMGHTTAGPAVAKVGGNWFCLLASGPTSYVGSSTQAGQMYVLNIADGSLLATFSGSESQAFMTGAVTVDVGLNYNVDTGYLGETYYDSVNSLWKGMVYRFRSIDDSGTYLTDPATWSFAPMVEADGPITAPAAVSFDSKSNLWVYYGTGRFYTTSDKSDSTTQYFYGVKDPYYNTGADGLYDLNGDDGKTKPGDVASNGFTLFNSTSVNVYTNKTVDGAGTGVDTWSALLTAMKAYDGWRYTLGTESTNIGERVLNKATVLGGIVFDTTFVPNTDPCAFDGDSNLLGLYYETGTAYWAEIFSGSGGSTEKEVDGETKTQINEKIEVGVGRGSGVSIHVGSQEGATGYVQQSTGIVEEIELTPAFKVRSGFVTWRER